ncbi:MAG: class II fructose-bisphosphate aldolase [Eubacterium sp.]
MLVTLSNILEEAYKKRVAVGAFNTVNLSSIRAVIDAAQKLNQPVILQHAQIHERVAPLDIIGPVMLQMAKAATVPVCCHLDHGEDITYLLRAMKMGFTSVMYDGSTLNYDENVKNTREVVQAAAEFGVSVEAELGRVLRPEGGAVETVEESVLTPEEMYTKPDEARAFVKATGIDALAIAFGTAHGLYDAEPKLDFRRIAEIREAVSMPLVMHGGSGVCDLDFKKAIAEGITKVNYFTYMSLAGGNAVKGFLKQNEKRSDVRYDEMAEAARIGMEADVSHAIEVFVS